MHKELLRNVILRQFLFLYKGRYCLFPPAMIHFKTVIILTLL